jgi:hypothetical protein
MSELSVLSRMRGLARPGLVVVTGVLALTLAACGGGTTPAAGAPTSTKSASSRNANTPPPGAFGTAAAVSATNVEVQNPQTGQVTVDFNSATTFTNTVSATLADVKAGSCVTVVAASGNMQTMTARTVTITQPTANGCAATGFGGGGGGGGGFRAGGGSRTPSPSRRPSGTPNPNAGRIAIGSVTAVQSNGFTVKDVARGQQAAQTTVVQTTSTTTFTQTQGATSAALAVGDCVAALGPSDDTGAITAKSISITKPGPSGCAQGFGGGRGFRGGNGGSAGGVTPSAIPGGGNG